MNPLVTIAIPTFNRTHYLREAVESAQAQTYDRVEILIGDNGTLESTRVWCEEAARRDERIRYRRNPRDLGLAGNFNALADAARGEFMAIVGDDDRLLPGFVGALLGAAGPGASVVFANHYLIDARGRRLDAESAACTRTYARDALAAGRVADAAAAVWRNSVPVCASLIRTDDARRLRFKEDLNTPEIEFFVRLANEGRGFVFVPEYLAEYRTHPQSATAAGLRSERLAPYLIPLPARGGAERYKRQFMAALLVNAVSRSLQRGDREAARGFLRSDYYPRPRLKGMRASGASSTSVGADGGGLMRGALTDLLRGGAQGLCAWLPASVGCPLYRAVWRAKASVGRKALS